MSHPSKRHIREQQLAKAIFQELSLIFSGAEDESLQQLDILRVEVGSGTQHFRVYYAPAISADPETAGFANGGEAGALIAEAGGYIHDELAPALNLKKLPDLTYIPDPLSWAEWPPK